MEANIHSLYEKVKEGNLVASHEGEISSELITDFLAKVEDSLLRLGENVKRIRKIYNILVEALQNLFHHQETPPEEFLKKQKISCNGSYSFCTMVKEDSGLYRITTGNFVRKEKTEKLKGKMEQLNSLSTEELKELYKVILNNNEFSEKGGGGLGFIEMARKSGNKFVYNFVNYNDKYNFFVLEVLIS